MSPRGNSRGIGTAGGLAALFVVVVIAQVSLPLLGSEPAGWIAGAPGAQADPLHREVLGAHRLILDDLLAAGFSPDGVADRSGVFHNVISGSEQDRVELVADVDGDGASDLLRYEVRDGSLVRTLFTRTGDAWAPVSSDVLTSGVKRFTLAFLDGARSTLPAAEVTSGRLARSVQVSLQLSRETGIGLASEALFGEVALRNLAG